MWALSGFGGLGEWDIESPKCLGSIHAHITVHVKGADEAEGTSLILFHLTSTTHQWQQIAITSFDLKEKLVNRPRCSNRHWNFATEELLDFVRFWTGVRIERGLENSATVTGWRHTINAC